MKQIMMLALCAALLLAGCGQRGESAPAGATTTSTSVSTTTTTTTTAAGETWIALEGEDHVYLNRAVDLYGFLGEDGEPCTDALYKVCEEVAEDRYFVRNEEYEEFITDATGQVIMPIGVVDHRGLVSSVIAWGDSADVPVRFFSDGGIYDRDGVLLSDTYDMIQCLEDQTVGALCEEGYFRLDLDGNRLERLDVVKDCGELPVGGYVKTQKEGLELTLHGVRTADGKIVLPELYQEILPLSADRIVGSDTCFVHFVGNPETHAVIVDGEGNTICDRYNYIRFLQQADGTYYPYGLAWRSNPEAWGQEGEVVGAETPDCYYYVIDWNGESQFEEEIVAYTGEGEGVVVLTFGDGETVRFSLLTGN